MKLSLIASLCLLATTAVAASSSDSDSSNDSPSSGLSKEQLEKITATGEKFEYQVSYKGSQTLISAMCYRC